jgi:ADP-ribose pyrophosphatase YjhB (NUDIX family)
VTAPRTEIIVRAVIRRDAEILLARQIGASWWFLPGGHVEPGERVEDALVREIAEELGTEARLVGLVGVVENRYADDEGAHHELNLVFEVAIASAEPRSREGHLEFSWLTLSALAGAELRPAELKSALLAADGDPTPFWRASPD